MKKIRLDALDNHSLGRLNKSQFYKLDFGIEEIDNECDIYSLVYMAALSGFSVIDVCANQEFINLAINAINNAKNKSIELNINSNLKTFLFSSFGVNSLSSLKSEMISEKIDSLKGFNIDAIDIHFDGVTFLKNIKNIDLIFNSLKDKIISVNLSRKKLSNAHIVDLLEKCFEYSKRNLIIEVEGMRFYGNDYNHILQTVSTADIINKQFRQKSIKYQSIPIILGNCTDGNFSKFAFNCKVPFNGISINYKSLNDILMNKSFSSNKEDIKYFLKEIKQSLMMEI